MQALLFVLSCLSSSALLGLFRALKADRVLTGRFIDGKGAGCLVHWLSGGSVIDRPSHKYWLRYHPFASPTFEQAIKTIIVGWDMQNPASIVKGAGYEAEYGGLAATKLTPPMVLRVLRKELQKRRASAIRRKQLVN